MSKSILVIDEPSNCKGCPLHRFVLDEVLNEWFVSCQLDTFIDEDEKRPSKCPLRPLPKKRLDTLSLVATGWNECLDAITGDADADS